jgi:hypothetical protein
MDAELGSVIADLHRVMMARGMSGKVQLRVPPQDVDTLRALLDLAPLPSPPQARCMDLVEFLAQAVVIGP